jgi:hypothetical protein
MTVENQPITMDQGYDVIDLNSDRVFVPDALGASGGVSGGGLWRAMLSHDRWSAVAFVLLSVAFFESPKAGGKRLIRCHDRSLFTESWSLC